MGETGLEAHHRGAGKRPCSHLPPFLAVRRVPRPHLSSNAAQPWLWAWAAKLRYRSTWADGVQPQRAPFRWHFPDSGQRPPGEGKPGEGGVGEARLAAQSGPSPWRPAGAARRFRPPPDVAARAPHQRGASLPERGAGLIVAVAPPALLLLLLLPPTVLRPAPSRPPPRLWLTGECGGPRRPAPFPSPQRGADPPPSSRPVRPPPPHLWRQRLPWGCGRGAARPGPGGSRGDGKGRGAVRGVSGGARAAGGTCAVPPPRQARGVRRGSASAPPPSPPRSAWLPREMACAFFLKYWNNRK